MEKELVAGQNPLGLAEGWILLELDFVGSGFRKGAFHLGLHWQLQKKNG